MIQIFYKVLNLVFFGVRDKVNIKITLSNKGVLDNNYFDIKIS